MIRHPRTFQERRANAAILAEVSQTKDEFGVAIKVRRSSDDVLPTEYDDLMPRPSRSWKNYRAIRYKEVEM